MPPPPVFVDDVRDSLCTSLASNCSGGLPRLRTRCRWTCAPTQPKFELRAPTDASGTPLTRADGRLVARLFHPDARLARQRAGVAVAVRDFAGRWPDPRISASVLRILESSVPHQWIATASLGLTLPLGGRLAAERKLAERQLDQATVIAWSVEQQVANELDRSWIAWSASGRRVQLLEQLNDGSAAAASDRR